MTMTRRSASHNKAQVATLLLLAAAGSEAFSPSTTSNQFGIPVRHHHRQQQRESLQVRQVGRTWYHQETEEEKQVDDTRSAKPSKSNPFFPFDTTDDHNTEQSMMGDLVESMECSTATTTEADEQNEMMLPLLGVGAAAVAAAVAVGASTIRYVVCGKTAGREIKSQE